MSQGESNIIVKQEKIVVILLPGTTMANLIQRVVQVVQAGHELKKWYNDIVEAAKSPI
jgi:hypothetical protein